MYEFAGSREWIAGKRERLPGSSDSAGMEVFYQCLEDFTTKHAREEEQPLPQEAELQGVSKNRVRYVSQILFVHPIEDYLQA